MKIVYVGNIDSVHTQRWAIHFAREGHQVHLVSAISDSSPIDVLEKANVAVHALNHRPFSSKQGSDKRVCSLRECRTFKKAWRCFYQLLPPKFGVFFTFYVLQAIRLRRLLRELKPDIVHGWYLVDYAYLAALSGYRPLMVSSWGTDVTGDFPSPWPSCFLNHARRFSLRRADCVTATTKFLAQMTMTYAPKWTAIEVVPFGVDCETFIPFKGKSSEFPLTIGFIKQLEPAYGPDYLIQAMAQVVTIYPNVRLLMVGKGSVSLALQQMVNDLGLKKQVEFLGSLPHSQIPKILADIDVFVMPSVCREAFGVSTIEASAMEIPVVATRVGGLPEAVSDGVTGILVEPRNEKALAAAVVKLIESPSLRAEMGRKGREYVLSRYRWEDCTAKMEALYQRLVRERASLPLAITC